MNSISTFKQILAHRLESKGLEKDIIPSFIRSMRICFTANPQMNHLKANKQLQFILHYSSFDIIVFLHYKHYLTCMYSWPKG